MQLFFRNEISDLTRRAHDGGKGAVCNGVAKAEEHMNIRIGKADDDDSFSDT
jgi:hypothetical protein